MTALLVRLSFAGIRTRLLATVLTVLRWPTSSASTTVAAAVAARWTPRRCS
jgi:hypothetical protein